MLFFPESFQYKWLLAPLLIFGRYALLCSWLFALFYGWKRRAWLHRKIQQRFPAGSDIRRETGYSFLTAVIFAATAFVLLGTPLRAYTQVYRDFQLHSTAYFLLSIVLAVLLHDTYFYWAHRLMHHPALYRRMHRTHHRSTNPSPWAAYAFHPLEAVAEAAILPLILILIPIHPLAVFIFITIMLWFNVYGHLGYELFPVWMYRHPLGRWLNSSVYHNLHHERFTGNYGLYFTFWDRLMGTLRRDNDEKVARVHQEILNQRKQKKSKTKSTVMSASKKNSLAALALVLLALPAKAQSTDWATDVAPILYNHCASCHRDGGIGGFSLIGYGNAYSNRYSILDATGSKRMPPWKADPAYRHFRGENLLKDSEIQTIADWVNANAPAGNMSLAPPDPVFTGVSNAGQPDEVLHTPFYTLTSFSDEYRCFVVPSGLQADAFLRGLEVLPGNHEAVHHVLVFEDTTGQAKLLDNQTPEPGYVSFGGINVQDARLVGAWVPGARTELLPPFMGVKLHEGSDLVFQVHFPGAAVGLSEMSTVNLFFTPTNQGIREVAIAPLLNYGPLSLENYPLSIPPNTVKEYHAKYTVLANASGIAVAPHMHLIGRSITCFGVTPLGDTIKLIKIPEWDFHWQGAYTFQQVQKVPFGTKLHAYATYDNTTNNPNNPSDPPVHVWAGEATTDEMMLVYFTYMIYQPGDENIVLDSTLLSTAWHETTKEPVFSEISISPNPAQDEVFVQYSLSETTDVLAEIVDSYGRSIKVFAMAQQQGPGNHRERALISDLPPGVYYVRLQSGKGAVQGSRLIKT